MSALCMKELPEPCFRFRHGEQIRWQSQRNLGKCWYLSFFSKHNGQYITTEISFDKSIYWISWQAFNNLTILLEIFIEILNKIRRSHNFFFSCVTAEFKIFLNHHFIWITESPFGTDYVCLFLGRKLLVKLACLTLTPSLTACHICSWVNKQSLLQGKY